MISILVKISKFGYLHLSDIDNKSALFAAIAANYLQVRKSAINTFIVSLTSTGAAYLADFGYIAYPGTELAVDGPNFFHRSLGNSYLCKYLSPKPVRLGTSNIQHSCDCGIPNGLHQSATLISDYANNSDLCISEYEILRNKSPATLSYYRSNFNKFPDALTLVNHSKTTREYNWIEVESTYKNYSELYKVFRLLTLNLKISSSASIVGIVFVVTEGQGHEQRILKAFNRFLSTHPELDPNLIANLISIAFCETQRPFKLLRIATHPLCYLLKMASTLNSSNNQH